jgi:hypothetical protein
MLLFLIPTVWFAIALLFAAVCRVASYGECEAIKGRA